MINIDMTQLKPEFYRAEDLAEILKVNIMTIYRYIKSGKIKAYKIGKEFRIDKKSFDDFLKETRI
jgi:excisionase family DNA binding protein